MFFNQYLQVFQIGNPVLLAVTTGAATGSNTVGSSLGDCVDDTFSVSSSGRASPVICGLNTGQHSKLFFAISVPLLQYVH